MNRNKLIEQVKQEYAQLCSDQSQQHFHQTTSGVSPQTYYENLLGMVVDEINMGTFDDFANGAEIVATVANDKSWLSQWDELRFT